MTTTAQRYALAFGTVEEWLSPLPRQSNESHEEEMRARNRPWTTEHYEAVRRAAIELVRTHVAHDLPGGGVRATFDGAALWELLGKLDRAGAAE